MIMETASHEKGGQTKTKIEKMFFKLKFKQDIEKLTTLKAKYLIQAYV